MTLAHRVHLQKYKHTLALVLCNEMEDLPFIMFKME